MPVIKLEDWNYKMYINGIYWKGFDANPTNLQREIYVCSFKNSDFYDGEEIVIDIKKTVE